LNYNENTVSGIVFGFICITSLLLSQTMSCIFNLDFLEIYPVFNFIMVPACITFGFVGYGLLHRSRSYSRIEDYVNRLINHVKEHPNIYVVLRFVDRHPMISAIILGTVIGVIQSITKYIVIF